MPTNDTGRQESDGTVESTENGLENAQLRCANCGHEWEYIGNGEETTCPSCRETFPVYVAHHFALLANEAWTPTVRLEVPERIQRAVKRRMDATDATEGDLWEFLQDYLSVQWEFEMDRDEGHR